MNRRKSICALVGLLFLADALAVYDQIPGSKKMLKVYPNLAHTSCVDFYNLSWTWLDSNFRNPTP